MQSENTKISVNSTGQIRIKNEIFNTTYEAQSVNVTENFEMCPIKSESAEISVSATEVEFSKNLKSDNITENSTEAEEIDIHVCDVTKDFNSSDMCLIKSESTEISVSATEFSENLKLNNANITENLSEAEEVDVSGISENSSDNEHFVEICFYTSVKNQARKNNVNNLKSKKKELRVVIDKMDVEKYFSNNKKANNLLSEPNIEQFDSEPKSEINSESDDEDIQSLILELKKGKLCEICNERFLNLDTHLNVSHKELNSSQIIVMLEKADLLSRTCPICKTVKQQTRHMNIHLLMHHEQDAFQCDKCLKKFNSFSSLSKHTKLNHSTNNEFSCSTCGQLFKSKLLLEKHLKIHDDTETNSEIDVITYSNNVSKNSRKSCEICNDSCVCLQSNKNLKTSKIEIQLSKVDKLSGKCPICKIVVTDKGNLQRHILQHGNSVFKCHFCLIRFSHITTLYRHIKLKHPTIKTNTCCMCGILFKTNQLLGKHIKKHKQDLVSQILLLYSENKNNKKPKLVKKVKPGIQNDLGMLRRNLCEICKKSFVHLYRHLPSHSELSKSQIKTLLDKADLINRTCPICKTIITNGNQMKAHISSQHRSTIYKCNDCSTKCITSSGLRKHRKRKHPSKKTHIFSCSFCNRSYKSKLALQRHIQKHMNDVSEINPLVVVEHIIEQSEFRDLNVEISSEISEEDVNELSSKSKNEVNPFAGIIEYKIEKSELRDLNEDIKSEISEEENVILEHNESEIKVNPFADIIEYKIEKSEFRSSDEKIKSEISEEDSLKINENNYEDVVKQEIEHNSDDLKEEIKSEITIEEMDWSSIPSD